MSRATNLANATQWQADSDVRSAETIQKYLAMPDSQLREWGKPESQTFGNSHYANIIAMGRSVNAPGIDELEQRIAKIYPGAIQNVPNALKNLEGDSYVSRELARQAAYDAQPKNNVFSGGILGSIPGVTDGFNQAINSPIGNTNIPGSNTTMGDAGVKVVDTANKVGTAAAGATIVAGLTQAGGNGAGGGGGGAGGTTPAAIPFDWSNPSTYDWGSIIGTGATLYGGKVMSDASSDAAAAQAAASAEAVAENRRQFDITQLAMKPWLDTGTKALTELSSAYGLDGSPADGVMDKVKATPGYQFRLNQGTSAIEGGAAARGGLFSGRTGKALNEHGQDYATNEFGNYTNRLSSLAGTGQTQSNNLANLGQNYSNNFGNLTTNAANSAGADSINRGNIWGSTLTGLSNIWANNRARRP